MPRLSQDLRHAVRGLRKHPGFAALAVLALALGIGATTTIFSVIHGVLLDPFPYLDADRVVMIQISDATQPRRGGRTGFQLAEFLDYQQQVQVFEDVIAGGYEDVLYTTGEGTEQFGGGLMSANTFQFLGVPALHGRYLLPEDAKPDAPKVFLMSHKMWVKQFNSDPSIVGRKFVLNGVSTTLVGIMPPRFTKLAADLYKPMVLDRANPETRDNYYMLQARLKRGVSLAQAQAHIAVVAASIAKQYPKNYPDKFNVKVISWVEGVIGPFRQTLFILAAAVGLLLLIACGNVANMLLSRAAAREREMAIRASIGATRGQLVQQLLVESLLLALLGTVFGCLLSFFGLKFLVSAIPDGMIPREAVIRLNLPVLLFSLGVAALTSLLFGLVPALQTARTDLVEPLRDAVKGGGGGARRGRLTGALVMAEVALSLVLLAGAGLLMRSFFKLTTVELGLNPDNVLHARLPLPRGQYETASGKQALFRQMLTRVGELPGVVSATTVSSLPPYGGIRTEVEIPGKVHQEKWHLIFQLVSEGYFRTLGLKLIQGRLLTAAEINDGRKLAVVNRTLVERYFGGENPIGRPMRLTMLGTLPRGKVDDPTFEIVGVVADAKNQGPREPIIPEAFIPYSITGTFDRGMLVRTATAPLPMVNSVRRAIWGVDRNVALTMINSLTESMKQFSYAEPRFGLVVLGVFAGVGLLLVALGVYSVIAYRVSRQIHDIGIRMALGASRGNVMKLVLRKGLVLIAGGIVLGLATSLVVTRILADQLYGIPPHDPATLAVVIAVVVAAGLCACYFPARRATRVDPMVALRSD
jgi:putative ABC transport system permease protein